MLIQNVEELGTELQSSALKQLRVLRQREVQIAVTGATEGVPPQVTRMCRHRAAVQVVQINREKLTRKILAVVHRLDHVDVVCEDIVGEKLLLRTATLL